VQTVGVTVVVGEPPGERDAAAVGVVADETVPEMDAELDALEHALVDGLAPADAEAAGDAVTTPVADTDRDGHMDGVPVGIDAFGETVCAAVATGDALTRAEREADDDKEGTAEKDGEPEFVRDALGETETGLDGDTGAVSVGSADAETEPVTDGDARAE